MKKKINKFKILIKIYLNYNLIVLNITKQFKINLNNQY